MIRSITSNVVREGVSRRKDIFVMGNVLGPEAECFRTVMENMKRYPLKEKSMDSAYFNILGKVVL